MTFSLAPLAGFTDAPFRLLCQEGGADLTYTEMVSAAGLAHGSSPTRHLMEVLPGERAVACQIFGSKEEEVAFAAAEAGRLATEDRPRFAEINLNAGCPMTKVTRSGAGAKLVESPERIFRLLRAMVAATDRPVTLKTRLGPHPARTAIFEILAAAEEAGAAGVILHARYTSQLHGGATHLDVLADAVRATRLPVTGNGSVTDAASLRRMAQTGVAGVMVGRAAVPDPGIFAVLKGGAPRPRLSWVARHLAYLLAFRRQLAAAYPEDHIPGEDGYASVKMHTHLFRYFNGLPGAAALRARLNKVRTLAEIREIIAPYEMENLVKYQFENFK
jgi:nifR3 family TIM-barrel protein